jgi:uncharacterized membrane-anchored protein YitT (DUF2179 family)
MPAMFIQTIQLHDMLLSVVFGGFLNAVAIGICLHTGAAGGGTDFIAILKMPGIIFLSEIVSFSS